MIVPSYYFTIIVGAIVFTALTALIIWNRIATRQYADALRQGIQHFRELRQERELLPEELQELQEYENELLQLI
jgi:cell shape-determining protein MreC